MNMMMIGYLSLEILTYTSPGIFFKFLLHQMMSNLLSSFENGVF